MSEPIYLIKLPHLKVLNANALSSPLTIGFPAMTAWLGFMHTLERKLNNDYELDVQFDALAVISHECNLQTYRGPDDFVNSIIGTGNPLDKDGNRSAFIEEARCHLDVSLLIKYEDNEDSPINTAVLNKIHELIPTMKLAGGDILSVEMPQRYILPDGYNNAEKIKLFNSLMPGYALIERRDLMMEAMQEGQDAMDALLDYVTVNNQCVEIENSDESKKKQFEWKMQRKTSGWIVPIATGFQGISPLGKAKNQRDPECSHRFAESMITLGQFLMVNKAECPDEILWCYAQDFENNLYLCEQVQPKHFTSGE